MCRADNNKAGTTDDTAGYAFDVCERRCGTSVATTGESPESAETTMTAAWSDEPPRRIPRLVNVGLTPQNKAGSNEKP